MGKQSTAALSVVAIGTGKRLAVPDDLTEPQARLWSRMVDSKPADWLTEDTLPLLKEYVRSSTMCDALELQVQVAIAAGESGDVKAFLKMRDVESRRLTTIATKLRLTPQSRYTPQAAATANKKQSEVKPWQAANG